MVIFSVLLMLISPSSVYSHGDVAMADHRCTLHVGPYSMLYATYQPQIDTERKYCDDIPYAGNVYISMQFNEDPLYTLSLDYRAIRDIKKRGNLAKVENLGTQAEIDSATAYYMQPKVYDNGVMLVTREFDKGDYIGIVTARETTSDKVYTSVFPFSVGKGSDLGLHGKHLVYAILLSALAIGIIFLFFLSYRYKRKEEKQLRDSES